MKNLKSIVNGILLIDCSLQILPLQSLQIQTQLIFFYCSLQVELCFFSETLILKLLSTIECYLKTII